jgi:hypothetical protein
VVEHRRLNRLRRQRLPSVTAQLAGHARSRVVSVPEDWPAQPGTKCRIVVGLDAVDAEADELLHLVIHRSRLEHTMCPHPRLTLCTSDSLAAGPFQHPSRYTWWD